MAMSSHGLKLLPILFIGAIVMILLCLYDVHTNGLSTFYRNESPASVQTHATTLNSSKLLGSDAMPKMAGTNRRSSFLANSTSPPFFRDVFNASRASSYPIGPDNTTDKDRYFIYRCDEGTMAICGGWTDRLIGVMAAYMIANLTGRTFKMEMLSSSCHVHDYIVPQQVDWYLPVSLHEHVTAGPDVAILDMINHRNKSFLINVDEDLRKLPPMQSKYVYFKYNLDTVQKFQALRKYKKQLGWMSGLTVADVNFALYRRLFKPSPYLLSKASAFLKKHVQPNESLVCAHVRMGTNPTLPNDVRVFHKKKDLPKVWNFLKEQTKRNNSRLFFMTDSEEVMNQARTQTFKDKLFYNQGKVVHIDKASGFSTKAKCEGLENIVFEQLILMHCDVLMISASGVSRMAAIVRGVDQGLFCFHRSGILEPCKWRQLKDEWIQTDL